MNRYFVRLFSVALLVMSSYFLAACAVHPVAPYLKPRTNTPEELAQISARKQVLELIEKRITNHVGGDFSGDVVRVGSKDAPVTVVMFQDLRCGMCSLAFSLIFEEVKQDYIDPGIVQWLFFEFPLGYLEEERRFAQAAKCAAEQELYVPFVGYLYHDPQGISLRKVGDYAGSLGANLAQFDRCFGTQKYEAAVRADFELGESLKVEGTPTFFINGRDFRQGADPEGFLEVLSEEISRVQGTT